MPNHGGYFIGNVGPVRMDFRWFCMGNCLAILSALATRAQSVAIMGNVRKNWLEKCLLRVCYPALEKDEWRIVTGCDLKNTKWNCHNGGSWPVLLFWLLAAASIKAGCLDDAFGLLEERIVKDEFPEYYDGEQARTMHTFTSAGYLVAKLLVEDLYKLCT